MIVVLDIIYLVCLVLHVFDHFRSRYLDDSGKANYKTNVRNKWRVTTCWFLMVIFFAVYIPIVWVNRHAYDWSTLEIINTLASGLFLSIIGKTRLYSQYS